ncbi:MAG: Luminescence regulatory protein LuxO [Candidatus Dependentiae bacterium ADurb.Bin331]|nr:MAG: Luminescence regulatory protein LuxO [Candidatus Dependentiae bacterium ADurb.Bin331]
MKMIEIFFSLLNFINSYPVLLSTVLVAFVFKLWLFITTISHGIRAPKLHRPWYFLIPVFAGAMFSDTAWIFFNTNRLFLIAIDYRLLLCLIRIAWAMTIIQYQFLGLFIESLTEKNYQLHIYQKILITISTLFGCAFIYLAIFEFDSAHNRPFFEMKFLFPFSGYYIFFLIIPSILRILKKIQLSSLPTILKKQLKLLIQFIIVPQLFLDFIQIFPFNFSHTYTANSFAVVSISTMLLTFAFYFTAKKIIGLRFLNFENHVQTTPHFNFIDDFKDVVEQLSNALTKQELTHITNTFFKNAFRLQNNRVFFYIRKSTDEKQPNSHQKTTYGRETLVEHFISVAESPEYEIGVYLHKHKIIITDEISFTNFYEDTAQGTRLVNFMNHIDADIFLPIYFRESIIGYIIVDRNSRPNEFYSRLERDEMMIFATYISNIVHMMQNRNLETAIEREKQMQEELYRKHQEINQYKESIQSFLRTTQQRKIGLLFFKNRRFSFGNQAAKELIGINPNAFEGHPLTKALKSVATQVQEYKSSQTTFTTDSQGNKLVLAALPHLDENSVIIMIYYPEIADILKNQFEKIANPSEWDYVLYLETTHSGKLINQLIPSSSPRLLQFKIELLKLALSKKALLLDLAQEDQLSMAEIIHHISLRETLHIITLTAPEKNNETGLKIFGLSPLFGGSNEPSLLEKLHNTGTLFIQNVHFLQHDTQLYLAEVIKYGLYRHFKSEQKNSINVRIICSTNQDLATLSQEGRFSLELFAELKQATLTLPPLAQLPENELTDLTHALTEQAIKAQPFKSLLELTEHETHRIVHMRPLSLYELKAKIEQFLVHKSKKNNIYHESHFDPGFNITDPELVHAARLGKKALRDPKMMAMLWQKFGNQNQIAQFLGVNRSSVNRRCKVYKLI